MKKKLFTLLLAIAASVGIGSAAITVRLDPSSCSSWSTVRLWAWTDEGNIFDSWPGQIVSQDGDGWYSYTFDASITSVSIIWNNGGTYQTVDIEGVTSSTCYALNSTSGTAITVSVVDCSSGSSIGGTPVSGKYKIDDLYYNLDATTKTAEVTYQLEWDSDNYKGLTIANIPSTVTYNSVTYSVTSIGEYAFYYCSGLTSVTIPNSVTSIGNQAFEGCSGLTSVTIPNSVTSIGEGAFEGCSGLTSVTIPNSVTSIGYYAFYNVANIIYSGSTTGSPWGARSVNGYVDGYLVYSDDTKTTLHACSSSAQGEIIIPNSVTSIGSSAFSGCSGLTSVTIPNSVTSIGSGAFAGCSGLTSITIPNSVTSIGGGAFSGCSGLTSVTIPNSVTSIGGGAFDKCTGLISVAIGNSVTSIGDRAFRSCTGLTSVTIPNSVTSIGYEAFCQCTNLTSITIPNSVTSIGSGAFSGCSGLTTVIWNAKNCADFASNNTPFYANYYDEEWHQDFRFDLRSQITSFTFGNEVEHIPANLCNGMSNLTSVTIGNSVTSIGEYAFYYCSGLPVIDNIRYADTYLVEAVDKTLSSYTIKEGTRFIGDFAFAGCSSLTSVTIPNSVTSIGSGAFEGCSSLTSVVWNAKNCADFTYSNSPFFNNDNDYSSFDLRNQITSFTFGNEVEHIPAYLCDGMSNLTSIVIPNSVTSIGSSAFAGCGINKIYFPGTMEEWLSKSWSPGQISSSYSLYINDVAVTNVVVPNSVTSIGEGAFTSCSSLISVTIPNSVTSIGYYAFYGCNNLKNVIIGSSVKVLEAAAFAYCPSIETITCYSQRPPTVNQDALYGLDYNTIVYVPADYLETYKMHDAWGLYDVRPLGAKSTETTDINVTPAETTAEVAWPAVSGAAMYELVIKDKDGNVICTLVFNSNGQLTQIAFNAPARNNAPQQTQAAGFSFTVTGLENGTSYDLTITSKDNNGTTLDTKTVSFTTTGEPQGINDVQGDNVQCTKILRNGQILILRGDKSYTLQGAEVK